MPSPHHNPTSGSYRGCNIKAYSKPQLAFTTLQALTRDHCWVHDDTQGKTQDTNHGISKCPQWHATSIDIFIQGKSSKQQMSPPPIQWPTYKQEPTKPQPHQSKRYNAHQILCECHLTWSRWCIRHNIVGQIHLWSLTSTHEPFKLKGHEQSGLLLPHW